MLLAKLPPKIETALLEILPGINTEGISLWHLLVGVVVLSLVLMLIETFSFRWACAIMKAEVLDFMPASGVIFVRTLVCSLICVALWLAVSSAAAKHHRTLTPELLISFVLFSFLLCSIAAAIVHANMLDENLGTGLLIFWLGLLFSAVLSTLISAVLSAIVLGLMPRKAGA